MPAAAYRTADELPELMTTETVRWMVPTVTFGLEIASGATGGSFASNAQAIELALEAWNAPSCSGLGLSFGGGQGNAAPDDGKNTIAFRTDSWATSGFPAGAVAFADVEYMQVSAGTWMIAEADIYLNADDYTWDAQSGDPATIERSVRAVLTHELGHAIGILHPCETDGAGGAPRCDSDASFAQRTMYPLYRGPEQQVLGSDDTAAVCSLYLPAPCEPPCGPTDSCVHGACIAICGGAICKWDESCIAGTCMAECQGAACFATGSCERDSDCGIDQVCSSLLCLPSGGGVGDPCSSTGSCTVGECHDGYCRQPCEQGTCAIAYACADAAVPVCVPEGASFAEPCTNGPECESGLCLLHAAPQSQCTRSCGSSTQLPCPSGFACDLVNGVAVCRPARVDSGCSLTPGLPPSGPPTWTFVLLILLLGACQRSGARR